MSKSTKGLVLAFAWVFTDGQKACKVRASVLNVCTSAMEAAILSPHKADDGECTKKWPGIALL